VLKDVASTGMGGGSLGCGFFLNLRDFKSEALVLGNCTAVCFDDETEGGVVAGVDVWAALALFQGFSFVNLYSRFTAGAPEAPLMRRFFRRRLFVLSDIDDVAETGREGGGPLEKFWHFSIPKIRKNRKENLSR